MASAYSTPKQFDNYVQPVNLELVNFVLGSKEQKFNYNIAKVEQTLADFGNLGLVRGQDKEYLSDRINTMIAQMGDVENMDWSDSNVERQITSGIKGAIDGRVRQDIKMSRQYTNYLKEVQEIKEKNPESYSDVNFAMGLKYSGADKWAAGEADEFANLQYIPKVDYMGAMNEVVKDYVDTQGTKEVDRISNGDGTYTTIEREVLRPETVRNLWEANMSPEMQRQMQMEADYMYGGITEPTEQAKVVDTYEKAMVQEQGQLKTEVDRLKSMAKGTSGAEKAKYEGQIQLMENRNIQLKQDLEKGIPYEQAYMQMHFKGTREKLVEANAFERQTDVKIDYDELKALKIRRDILAQDKELAVESGAAYQYSKVGDPFAVEDRMATTVFQRTEEAMTSAVEGFAQSMIANENFVDSYGITKQEFENKTPEERITFATDTMNKLMEEGIDLSSDKSFSGEELQLYSKYTSNKAVYDEVNTEVEATTNEVAKTTFNSLKAAAKAGTVDPSNYYLPAIRNAIMSTENFENLKPDVKNAFRAGMIDESIRNGNIDENMLPYILKQREQLLSNIKDQTILKDFPKEEDVIKGKWELAGEGILELIKTGWSMHPFGMAAGLKTGETLDRYGELTTEFYRKGEKFGADRDISDLDDETLGRADFIVDGKAIDADDYIRNKYAGIAASVEAKASDLAPKLTSTSALVISPNIKEQKETHSRMSGYIASNNEFSVDDIKDSEIYLRVNPENETVVFTAKLGRSSAKFYESEGDRLRSSKPIPINDISDLRGIMDRLKTEDKAWSLNSENRYAQGLTFNTSGFDTPEQRQKAVRGMTSKLSQENAIRLMQTPASLGLTHTEIEGYMQELTREKKDGSNVAIQTEFPNAYNSLTTGKGKFEIKYSSRHNQGYFMDINYRIGNRVLDIQNAIPTGDKALNPDEAYLEAYQAQTEILIDLMNGYAQGNPEALKILREIEKAND